MEIIISLTRAQRAGLERLLKEFKPDFHGPDIGWVTALTFSVSNVTVEGDN